MRRDRELAFRFRRHHRATSLSTYSDEFRLCTTDQFCIGIVYCCDWWSSLSFAGAGTSSRRTPTTTPWKLTVSVAELSRWLDPMLALAAAEARVRERQRDQDQAAREAIAAARRDNYELATCPVWPGLLGLDDGIDAERYRSKSATARPWSVGPHVLAHSTVAVANAPHARGNAASARVEHQPWFHGSRRQARVADRRRTVSSHCKTRRELLCCRSSVLREAAPGLLRSARTITGHATAVRMTFRSDASPLHWTARTVTTPTPTVRWIADRLFAPLIYKNEHFIKTGSGQT